MEFEHRVSGSGMIHRRTAPRMHAALFGCNKPIQILIVTGFGKVIKKKSDHRYDGVWVPLALPVLN